MLVLAGPGSGKTFVMIQRVQYLISHFHVEPSAILVISFSRASAAELKERFQKQREVPSEGVNFATFHACFFHILKTTLHYSVKDIITHEEQRNIMKILLSDPLYEERDSREKEEEYIRRFSYYKNKGLKVMEEKESLHFCRLFHAYQKEMHSRHKLDFDDMGLLCLQLFRNNPGVLADWQSKYTHILIDEFQDINPVQFQVIRLLTEKRKNLFVVGDDDQAIYSFRGASPQIMLNFEKLYPDTKKVLLETNFRCSGNIVQKSLEVIEKNRFRFHKRIAAYHSDKEPVMLKKFENTSEEYSYIRKRINQLIQQGAGPSDITCIFRTNQNMLGLADYFIRHRIPFSMKEQTGSIFQHFIARDILSYLQFFLEGKKRKDFFSIMNKPLRYLSRNACSSPVISWEELENYYQAKPYMQEIIGEIKKHEKWVLRLDLYGAINYIRKVIGYEQYIKDEGLKQGMEWEEAVEILNFLQNSTRGTASLEQWRREIEEYEEALKQAKEESREGIQLITMHACKGLEYPYVFLPDCNEGKIPHKKAHSEEELEEERRIFYVAMTRAKERLEILYIQDKLGKKLQPSRFLSLERKPWEIPSAFKRK